MNGNLILIFEYVYWYFLKLNIYLKFRNDKNTQNIAT